MKLKKSSPHQKKIVAGVLNRKQRCSAGNSIEFKTKINKIMLLCV
jgi:hypothetical protein